MKTRSRAKTPRSNPITPKTTKSSQAAAAASSYLRRWEQERSTWKFEKLKQTWLLKHALRPTLVSDADFEVLLNYLTGLRGPGRGTLLREMRGRVNEGGVEGERAAAIVQVLSEGDIE